MGTPLSKLNGLEWSLDDLCKKFNHSYLLATVKQVTNVWWLDDVDVGNGYLYASKFENGNIEERKILRRDFFVENDRPPPCITNCDNHAFLFRYNPERQWRRGLSTGNTILLSPNMGMIDVELTRQRAEKCFFPSHTPFKKALEQMTKEKNIQARALDNVYSLVRENDSNFSLYRRQTRIGQFAGKRFFVQETAGKLFSSEIMKELPFLREQYAYQ